MTDSGGPQHDAELIGNNSNPTNSNSNLPNTASNMTNTTSGSTNICNNSNNAFFYPQANQGRSGGGSGVFDSTGTGSGSSFAPKGHSPIPTAGPSQGGRRNSFAFATWAGVGADLPIALRTVDRERERRSSSRNAPTPLTPEAAARLSIVAAARRISLAGSRHCGTVLEAASSASDSLARDLNASQQMSLPAAAAATSASAPLPSTSPASTTIATDLSVPNNSLLSTPTQTNTRRRSDEARLVPPPSTTQSELVEIIMAARAMQSLLRKNAGLPPTGSSDRASDRGSSGNRPSTASHASDRGLRPSLPLPTPASGGNSTTQIASGGSGSSSTNGGSAEGAATPAATATTPTTATTTAGKATRSATLLSCEMTARELQESAELLATTREVHDQLQKQIRAVDSLIEMAVSVQSLIQGEICNGPSVTAAALPMPEGPREVVRLSRALSSSGQFLPRSRFMSNSKRPFPRSSLAYPLFTARSFDSDDPPSNEELKHKLQATQSEDSCSPTATMERGLESHGHSTLARRKTRKLVGSFVPDFKVDSAFGVYGSFRRRPTTETQKFGASRPKVLTHAEMRHGIMESDAFAAVDPSVLAAAQMEEPKEKPSMWASALAFWGFEEQALDFFSWDRADRPHRHRQDGRDAKRRPVVEPWTLQRQAKRGPMKEEADNSDDGHHWSYFRARAFSFQSSTPGHFGTPSLKSSKSRKKSFFERVRAINPQGSVRVIWDVLMLAPYLATLLLVPTIIAFPHARNLLKSTSLVLSIIFAFDTVIRVLSHRVLEPVSLYEAFRMNAKSTQFWIDVVSSVPFCLLLIGFGMDEFSASKVLILKLLRLHRLNQLFRVRPLFYIFTRVQLALNIGANATAVIGVAIVMMVFFHLMSCLIFTLGTSRDFQDPWWSSDKVVQELPNKGWRWWSAYTFGVWSALSNTLPVTSSFRPTSVSMQWTFIALAAMNASLSAALTGTVAAFYSVESGSIHARYKKKMDELSEYLAVQNLPKDLKDQMILSIETKYQGKMFDEASILAGLNESLRQELVLHNCRHILESITFLRLPNGDPKLSWKIRRLSTGLRHRVFVRNETLYKRNAHGTSMFLVVEGCASVRLGRINLGTLNPGSYFGEMSVLAPGPRFETVVAVTNMICMELDGATVLSVVAETPEAKRRMNEACAERIQALDELCDNVFRASLFGPGCIIDEFSEGGDIRGDASVGAADAYERGAAVRGAGGHRVSLGEAMSLNRRSLHQTV